MKKMKKISERAMKARFYMICIPYFAQRGAHAASQDEGLPYTLAPASMQLSCSAILESLLRCRGTFRSALLVLLRSEPAASPRHAVLRAEGGAEIFAGRTAGPCVKVATHGSICLGRLSLGRSGRLGAQTDCS